eukprot:CAMPEP_0177443562 /NCGR_PEP_ID=MMETSP0369-20130122/5533_1 /TAXON_ID=447022 ORGANISM="Scrippsiella hangoei-like, Strain SHHI-4" /NCGR_SAMPLE_ID=MMETSP0369 /ASSEMBLY_ACC=CAM_ASM_000364 /LENGTH=365 /DNA_ID=CAMNT_0018915561 /DNA_START=806 /DNA_END=1903 /DNA_ORIENTATION=+
MTMRGAVGDFDAGALASDQQPLPEDGRIVSRVGAMVHGTNVCVWQELLCTNKSVDGFPGHRGRREIPPRTQPRQQELLVRASEDARNLLTPVRKQRDSADLPTIELSAPSLQKLNDVTIIAEGNSAARPTAISQGVEGLNEARTSLEAAMVEGRRAAKGTPEREAPTSASARSRRVTGALDHEGAEAAGRESDNEPPLESWRLVELAVVLIASSGSSSASLSSADELRTAASQSVFSRLMSLHSLRRSSSSSKQVNKSTSSSSSVLPNVGMNIPTTTMNELESARLAYVLSESSERTSLSTGDLFRRPAKPPGATVHGPRNGRPPSDAQPQPLAVAAPHRPTSGVLLRSLVDAVFKCTRHPLRTT